MRFVPASVSELLEKLDAYKNHMATPPDYEKQSAKFLYGVRAFEHYVKKYVDIVRGEG
jgi:hypothetical protein